VMSDDPLPGLERLLECNGPSKKKRG
jgi:hypothetical protein